MLAHGQFVDKSLWTPQLPSGLQLAKAKMKLYAPILNFKGAQSDQD